MSRHGIIATVIATELSIAVAADEKEGNIDIAAGLYGKYTSKWIRDTAQALVDAQLHKSKTTGE